MFQVRHGYCAKLSNRVFLKDAIPQSEVGLRTPRTFVSYTYMEGVIPDPVEYRQSLENSFEPDVLRKFCRKMLQLLCKENFPFKAKKIAIFGESDSGKTTWFAPFKAIIGEDNVADIVDEGRFAMQMVNEDTECIFMDEWDIQIHTN